MNEHVLRARQIADALDSPNPERTLHEQFYDEWKAWEAEDPTTRSMKAFDRAIGRGNDYTGRIVRFVTGGADRATPFSDSEGRAERTARQVLRERPEIIAEALAQADPDVRSRVADKLASTPQGIGAMEAMHRSMTTRDQLPLGDEPLPSPPAFASKFWRAVNALQDANAELERFGIEGLEPRPETRAAAERMTTLAAAISTAVVDYVVENIA